MSLLTPVLKIGEIREYLSFSGKTPCSKHLFIIKVYYKQRGFDTIFGTPSHPTEFLSFKERLNLTTSILFVESFEKFSFVINRYILFLGRQNI